MDLKTNNTAQGVINGAATLWDAAHTLYTSTVRVVNTVFGMHNEMGQTVHDMLTVELLDRPPAVLDTNILTRASHLSDAVFMTEPLYPTISTKQVSKPMQSKSTMTRTASASSLVHPGVFGLLKRQLDDNTGAA